MCSYTIKKLRRTIMYSHVLQYAMYAVSEGFRALAFVVTYAYCCDFRVFFSLFALFRAFRVFFSSFVVFRVFAFFAFFAFSRFSCFSRFLRLDRDTQSVSTATGRV